MARGITVADPPRLVLTLFMIFRSNQARRRFFSAPPPRYFNEVGKLPNLPTVADELQHVAVGCYTAEAEIKKNNRAAEAALATGEKMAVLGSVLAGSEYPAAEFAASWKKVLLMQFHDSLAGSAAPEQYDVARQAYGSALEAADQAINLAAEKIAWQIPTTDPNSEYLVVFNPHAWDAKLNVEYDLGFSVENSGQFPNSLLEDEARQLHSPPMDPGLNDYGSSRQTGFQRAGAGFRVSPVPAAKGPAAATARFRGARLGKGT